ncbi:MAG: DUF192 domain-containing protein [Bacteroidota bacterium]
MKKKSKPTKNELVPNETARQQRKRPRKGTNWKTVFKVAALLLAVVAFIFSSIPFNNSSMNSKPSSSSSTNAQANPSRTPTFKKEGNLQFIKADGQTEVAAIDIEVAQSEYERAQGLMHRRYMAQNQGMLFIMDQMETQSFYMRNTHIPLDILYVDDQKKIVSIQKNTVPLSEESLFSTGPALYVVEVNAGYCDQYGIAPGDLIAFELD